MLLVFPFLFFVVRVVSLSLCPHREYFVSGSLDRTVLLWDQRTEKAQVGKLKLLGVSEDKMPSKM